MFTQNNLNPVKFYMQKRPAKQALFPILIGAGLEFPADCNTKCSWFGQKL